MLDVSILHRGSFEARCLQVEVGGKKMVTPTYFPSISSAATRIQLVPLIKDCISSGYPRLLISAYDIFHNEKGKSTALLKLIKDFSKKDKILFLDSGTFESYWLRDKKWSYAKYEKIIKRTPSEFFAGFDEIPLPHAREPAILKNLIKYVKKSCKLENQNHCITICQGLTPIQLCNLVKKITNNDKEFFQMIAIPERYCGKTLDVRIKTIKKIRKILNKKNPESILHILGCGHPISIALFAFAGADSFDSVDWSRWVIERTTLSFRDNTHISLLNCSCRACSITKMDPTHRFLLHNLLFYQDYLNDLRYAITMGDELNLLARYCDQKILSKIVNFF